MPNAEKVKFVEELSDQFKNANSIFVVDFTGMSANETVELRKKFKSNNVQYRVVRNTLAKLSFEKAGYSEVNEYLTGVNGYVMATEDPTLPVKLLKGDKALKGKFAYKLAVFEGKFVAPESLDAIADLPSRGELLGQLLGTLQAPLGNLTLLLKANFQEMLGVLESLKEKKDNKEKN